MSHIPQSGPSDRAQIPDDSQRPLYHFLPPANWMNDPNGLIQWQGQYHLFYQYNPHGPFWGSIHWGHAVSADLVHWEHLPIALAPTPGSADEDGCWSGCAVDDDGVPTLIYSGDRNRVQRACLATSSDGLVTWDKYPGNPVVADTPGLDLVAYRDHTVWREDGMWYQGIGAGIVGEGGTVFLYRSPDLRHWEYLHPLLTGDAKQMEPFWTGTMWECPAFFPLGDKHVLLVSVWHDGRLHYTAAFVGTYAGQRFVPERLQKLDYGDRYFYAPQTMLDDQERRIVFGWLPEGCDTEAQLRAGWAGVMSLPRVLSLAPDGGLQVAPAQELTALRGAHRRVTAIPIGETVPDWPDDLRGDTVEIGAVIDPSDAAEVGLKLRSSPNGAEETTIVYDRAGKRLVLNRDRSSIDESVERTAHSAPLGLAPGEPLVLRVFLDRSVIEVFANERVTLTSRVYPAGADSTGIAPIARGGTAGLRELDLWQMRSIW